MTGRALILGRGAIGTALANRLASEGATVVHRSRRDGLDWEDPAQAEEVLHATAKDGPFDLVIDATGALVIDEVGPEKALSQIDAAAMARQFAVNAIGPALVAKHAASLLPRKGRAILATLSARVGSIGDNRLGGWISYRASKAALNQIVRTASIEMRRRRPDAILVALHPGTVATPLSKPFAGNRETFPPEQAARTLISVIDRLAPDDTGTFKAWDGTEIPW